MGGKKKRLIVYTGSLLKPVFRYMVKMQFNMGVERRGGAIADEMFKQLQCTPKKFLQPNLEVKYGPTDNVESSIYFKYTNGWEYTMPLGRTDQKNVKAFIEYYNNIIECDRAEKGQDDEPEDEESYVK
jgi:hypothetical protein